MYTLCSYYTWSYHTHNKNWEKEYIHFYGMRTHVSFSLPNEEQNSIKEFATQQEITITKMTHARWFDVDIDVLDWQWDDSTIPILL